jgi:hypothetical protein
LEKGFYGETIGVCGCKFPTRLPFGTPSLIVSLPGLDAGYAMTQEFATGTSSFPDTS